MEVIAGTLECDEVSVNVAWGENCRMKFLPLAIRLV